MGNEGCRRSMGNRTTRDKSCGHPFFLSHFQQGWNRFLFCIDTDGAIVRFYATGKSCGTCRTVGHEIIRGMRFVKTNVFESFKHGLIIVHVHRAGDLRQTHTIPN